MSPTTRSATLPSPSSPEVDSAVDQRSTLTSPAASAVLPMLPRAMRGLLAAVLAVVLLAVVAAVPAAAAPDAGGSVVLAVDGAGLLGPDPAPRDADENPARDLGGYEDREVPFTWGAAWLLTFLGLGGLATMGLVYWRAVDRPGRDKAPSRR